MPPSKLSASPPSGCAFPGTVRRGADTAAAWTDIPAPQGEESLLTREKGRCAHLPLRGLRHALRCGLLPTPHKTTGVTGCQRDSNSTYPFLLDKKIGAGTGQYRPVEIHPTMQHAPGRSKKTYKTFHTDFQMDLRPISRAGLREWDLAIDIIALFIEAHCL